MQRTHNRTRFLLGLLSQKAQPQLNFTSVMWSLFLLVYKMFQPYQRHTFVTHTKSQPYQLPYNLEGMDSRLQVLLAHTHLRRLLMCTINIYVDHINITDKDSATFTGDLGFSPHTKPTWPGKSGH